MNASQRNPHLILIIKSTAPNLAIWILNMIGNPQLSEKFVKRTDTAMRMIQLQHPEVDVISISNTNTKTTETAKGAEEPRMTAARVEDPTPFPDNA